MPVYSLDTFGLYKNALKQKIEDRKLFQDDPEHEVLKILDEERGMYTSDEIKMIVENVLFLPEEEEVLKTPHEYHHLSVSAAQRNKDRKEMIARVLERERVLLDDYQYTLKMELRDIWAGVERIAHPALASFVRKRIEELENWQDDPTAAATCLEELRQRLFEVLKENDSDEGLEDSRIELEDVIALLAGSYSKYAALSLSRIPA